MIDKLPESYTSFILAINKKRLNYISINLYNIIYYITQYLKSDSPKMIYARFNASNLAYSNK